MERSTVAASGNEVADVSDLRRMFTLLSRIPDGVEPMLVVMKKFVVTYVSDKVAALGKKAEQPEDYCEVLIHSLVFCFSVLRFFFLSDLVFLGMVFSAQLLSNKRSRAIQSSSRLLIRR